ncbi:MAG TPA: insulinase family protein [Deltaproteobacteria bacterium]|nr:insulinase family protein [Deltaproteobacteria bacterium]
MVRSSVLDNGIRIITETMSEVRSVSLGIWVKVGSRHDPSGHLGIAHFTEHMLFKGTGKRSAVQIAREIDALGGVLNAQTAKEYTVYYTRVLDEHLDKAADVLFDLFLDSRIDPEELEKEKKVVLQEISMTEDAPDDYITDLFADAFFPNSPLGTSILGSSETVSSFRQEHIFEFIEQFYQSRSIVIAAVGNVEHARIEDLVATRFDGIKSHCLIQEDSICPKPTGCTKAYYRDIEQVHINLGTVGSAMNDERRWTYILLNTMLGGSMSSMLFQEAREKLGLVYAIYSYLSSYRDCGVLAMYAATTPDNIRKTLEIIGRQMIRIKQGALKDESIDDVKAQIKGNLLLSRESTVSRMSSLAKNEIYYNREVSVEEVIQKIQAVSLDDIIALANDIFTRERLTLVSLGKMDQQDIKEITIL